MYENINGLLKKSIKNNLYDTHPPFQIDGNFGIAEAILEALIQSHNSYIELLPALPQQWKDGGLTGVRLRGGLTGDLSWKEHKVMEFAVTADKDMCVTVKYKDTVLTRECRAGERTALL